MPSIIKRPRARSDLAEIWDYIAADNETRADAFVDLIDHKFQALASHPHLGRSRDELEEGLRSFPVDKYIFKKPQGFAHDFARRNIKPAVHFPFDQFFQLWRE